MENPPKKFNIYKFLTTLSIIGIFFSVGMFVFGFTRYTPSNKSAYFLAVFILFILSVACILSLPWAKWLSEKKFKIPSIVFLCFIGVCCVLWIIAMAQLINIFNNLGSLDEKQLLNSLGFFKVVIIISIQFAVATIIGRTVLNYQKNMIVFQVIMYVSYLFLDFYVTFLMSCLLITSKGFNVSPNIYFLTNSFMVIFLVIAILYISISNFVLKRVRRKNGTRVNGYLTSAFEDSLAEENETKSKSTKQKLAELKEMLDNNLITQEEYEAKRKQTLDDM